MSEPHGLGIPPLDRVLPRVPHEAGIALLTDPGLDPTPFLYQATHAHLAAGATVTYASLSTSPAGVVSGMREFGFGSDVARDALQVIDLSTLAADDLKAALRARPADLVVLDSLPALARRLAPARPDEPGRMLDWLTERGRLLTACERAPGAGLEAALEGFDGVVALHEAENPAAGSPSLTVERARWTTLLEHRPIPFKAYRPGGVFLYVPKVVVTGPYHAGKSTFVKAVAAGAVSVNRLGTTVALDHGHALVEGLAADLFGTPGQERFDPLLKTIAKQASGVVVVVDSTKPDGFQRARRMLTDTAPDGLPAVVAANKQDLPGALSTDEIARRMSLPPGTVVMPCVATEPRAATAVLRTLLSKVVGTADGAPALQL